MHKIDIFTKEKKKADKDILLDKTRPQGKNTTISQKNVW